MKTHALLYSLVFLAACGEGPLKDEPAGKHDETKECHASLARHPAPVEFVQRGGEFILPTLADLKIDNLYFLLVRDNSPAFVSLGQNFSMSSLTTRGDIKQVGSAVCS